MEQNTKKQQGVLRRGIAMAVFIAVLIAAAIIVYMQMSKSSQDNPSITTYQECKEAGGAVAELAPEQCKLDGETYVSTDEQPRGVDDEYIGLTEKEALNKAKENNVPARIVSRDGKSLNVTGDLRNGRLNFTIENGKVTKVDKEEINIE